MQYIFLSLVHEFSQKKKNEILEFNRTIKTPEMLMCTSIKIHIILNFKEFSIFNPIYKGYHGRL